MDFMKVIDQTVREIKREVNLKVLKVPEIEQKVLDATDNEPWGPHGSALAEIAQATKRFSECQMVMNVLWTRLTETGKDWRYVYKALAVIEYLVSHGSESALDDIIEHTFQISSLSSFEYVEPNGKDVGINVRRKAETITALLNNKDKIQEVRNKAATNRDKYVGLSSSGITYKSGSASFGGGGYQSNSRYGGFGSTRDGDSFRDSDAYRGENNDQDSYVKTRRGAASENQGNSSKASARNDRKDQNNTSYGTLKTSAKSNDSAIRPQSSNAPADNYEDDFDDFDPRGISNAKAAAAASKQVDLLGESLIGDFMDAQTPVPSEKSTLPSNSSEVDLFADADFVSASPPQTENGANSQKQTEVDLFGSEPAVPSSVTPPVDLFSTPAPVMLETKSPTPPPANANIVDPFAAVPLNSFDGSDLFGAFTSTDPVSSQPSQSAVDGSPSNQGGKPSAESKTSPKRDTFNVKSGIWADSLSRGLIDINITAPKKVSLADVGVVGGLSDGAGEREKGFQTYYSNVGRAMGAGSGLGLSGFTPSQGKGDDIFSQIGSQQYQFGGFQK